MLAQQTHVLYLPYQVRSLAWNLVIIVPIKQNADTLQLFPSSMDDEPLLTEVEANEACACWFG